MSRSPAQNFPEVKIPESYEPWELGRKENWGILGTTLKPMDGFRVTSAAGEAHLTRSRKFFDDSRGPVIRGIIDGMLAADGGSENIAMLKKLLALGLHPDLQPNHEARLDFRPSHLCGELAKLKSAKAISLCRPNLQARNKNNHTPLEAARGSYEDNDPSFPEAKKATKRPAVARVWDEVQKKGFPSIAEMANKKQWFAVQNLCRRGVICRFTEGATQYQGKTAIEWAILHGEKSLAEELRYYLERFPSDIVVAIEEGAQHMESRLAALETTLAASSTSPYQKKLDEQKDLLEEKLQATRDAFDEGQAALCNEIKALQNESKQHREELDHNVAELESQVECNRRRCEGSEGSLSTTIREEIETLREEFVQALTESKMRHREEMQLLQRQVQSLEYELAQKDSELRKMRRSLDKVAERQKDLEEDVEDLEEALEEVQKKNSPTARPSKRRDEWK